MKKVELITSILDLYDEIERLSKELERGIYQRNLENKYRNSPDTRLTKIEEFAIEYAKDKLVDEITLFSWNREVKVSKNTETGQLEYTTFERWLEKTINKDRIPKNLSYEEVINFLDEKLKSLYVEEKNKALAKFEEKEEVKE